MDAKKIALLEQGPFPNHVDPWLTKETYFDIFQAALLRTMCSSLIEPLVSKGYDIWLGPSLQRPLYPWPPELRSRYQNDRYIKACQEIGMDTGIVLVNDEKRVEAVYIKSSKKPTLTTIIEVILPATKASWMRIDLYQPRHRAMLESDVDIVEIDLSYSESRLMNGSIMREYPYHLLVHLCDGKSYFWGMELEKPLKSVAIPLEDKAIPLELNRLYRQSYSELGIAWQMFNEGHYTAENLPFPTTISDEEREKLLADLLAWQEALK